jgi:2-polyprenyl-6-methoxyphenol hydroxylase-like FAD-dependent oxidoreductase
MSNVLGRQAVVTGAGMSGLAAAGVLANHFEQVTVLERDGLADHPSYRPGTPQSSCMVCSRVAWRRFAGFSLASIAILLPPGPCPSV